jgi:hypothetical protein
MTTLNYYLGITLLLSVSAFCPLQAAEKPAEAASSPAAAVEKKRPMPYSGKVHSVDKEAKTFTLQSQKNSSRVFTVTAGTRMLKGEAAATWDDIKPGEEVRGQAHKIETGKYEAVSVFVGPKADGKNSGNKGKNEKPAEGKSDAAL